MSALKEAIAARRAETSALLPSPCVTVGAPQPAVMFRTWAQGIWIFPWIHLVSAHYAAEDGVEQMIFRFGAHEIVAEGVHLHALLPEIAALRLHSLRELPPGTAFAKIDEPQVRRLTVATENAAMIRPD